MALAIFDLDGTLVDSLKQISVSMNEARNQLGYPDLALSKYREILGQPVQKLISDLELSIDSQNTLVSEFRRILTLHILKENILFPGVLQVLERIVESGFKLAIATTKPSHIAKLVVENSQLSNFDFFVQGTDGFLPKPNPEVIVRSIRNFACDSAVMIGDRVEDVLAAKAAGIPSIGIASSGHSIEELSNAGAHRVFRAMENLCEVLTPVKNLEDFFGLAQTRMK